MNTPIAGTETSWRIPAQALRWNAVVAGMAVGIAIQLLLSMLGGAAGLAMSGASYAGVQPAAVPVFAGVWSAASLVVAAIAGGYVAARSTGFRRMGDGALHGAVAWGATTVFFALLAAIGAGATLGGLVGLVVGGSEDDALELGAAVSAWLAAAVVLSLIAAIVGGTWGVRSARRLTRRRLSAPGVAPPSTAGAHLP
jgi:hypothetical protein